MLAERVRVDEKLELGNELGTDAEREIGLDALLERSEPKLFEPFDLGPRPVLVGELVQGRAAPEREGLPQQAARRRRRGGPGIREQLLEAVQVE